MKRDLDLIRKILLKIEEHEGDDQIQNLQIVGYSKEQIAYNVYLLENAGLINGRILFGTDSVKPHDYVIFRLNWQGHEFLDACRDDDRWAKAKVIFRQAGGVTFDIAKEILIQLALRAATAALSGGAI